MREPSGSSNLDLDVDAIVAVLEEVPVERGVLFGSYARGDERTTSDIDLAVAFDESLPSIERTRVRLQVIERVSAVLGLDSVDVIPLSDAPSELRREINEDGIAIYGPPTELETSDDVPESDHAERIERFDEVVADLERVV